MQFYVLWALIGFGLAPWVMIIFWLPDPPPDSWGRYILVSVVAAAGAVVGGVIASYASSNPMPGIVGAIAGASAFVGVTRQLGRKGVAN
jgi:hypothetical protein